MTGDTDLNAHVNVHALSSEDALTMDEAFLALVDNAGLRRKQSDPFGLAQCHHAWQEEAQRADWRYLDIDDRGRRAMGRST